MIELALLFIEEFMFTNRAVVGDADKDPVSSDVFGPAIDVSAGVIDVTPVLHAYQVGNLCHEVRAAVESRERASLRKAVDLADLLRGHRLEAGVNIVLDPRHSISAVLGLIDREAFAFEVLSKSLDDDAYRFKRKREVALRAKQQRAIGHDSAVTTRAVRKRDFQFAVAIHDPTYRWNDSVFGDRVTAFAHGIRVAEELHYARVIGSRNRKIESAEDRAARFNPIAFGLELLRLDQPLRPLLDHPLAIALWFFVGSIDRIRADVINGRGVILFFRIKVRRKAKACE